MLKPTDAKGIYAIIVQKSIIYIGQTSRTFAIRWKEHTDVISGRAAVPKGQAHMYSYLQRFYEMGSSISFSALKGFPATSKISIAELEAIEGTYIEIYKPLLNTIGVNKPYRYGKDNVVPQQVSIHTIKKLRI